MRYRPLSRTEIWLAIILVFAATLAVGMRGRLIEHSVNWDGLAAVAHAYDVFHAESNANLAMIGFVQPPLPALLQLGFAVVAPGLATSGLAANVMGALALAIAAMLLLGMAAQFGMAPFWRWLLTALFVLHPMAIGPAATGSPLAILLALLMGACWALVRWRANEGLRELIAASVLLALVVITRYEAIFIVIGALIYVAWRVRKGGGSWSRLEGTMITFAMPIVYVLAIWIGANWAIMGDPWHFVRRSFIAADGGGMPSAVLRVSFVCFFPILALMLTQIRDGRYAATARPLAWLTLTAAVAPLVFQGMFGSLDAPGDWDRLMTLAAMVLVGGYAMLAVTGGEMMRGVRTLGSPGLAATALASLVLSIWLVSVGAGLPLKVTDAWAGRGPLADDGRDVVQAAGLLRETQLAEGRHHVVAGWPGFALVLFSGQTGRTRVVQLMDLPAEMPHLGVGSMLVVLEEGIAGVPPERIEERWRQGQWHCYEFVR